VSRLGALARDQRGSVESLVVLLPILLACAAMAQLIDYYAHELIVRGAASAAARAAVVVLTDDGSHYGDPGQRTVNRPSRARMAEIERAARMVLSASPSLHAGQRALLRIAGQSRPADEIEVTVDADYTCFIPGVAWMCGRDGKVAIVAKAALRSQFAPYRFAASY
jgi:Flp pilus assembly protein TadG